MEHQKILNLLNGANNFKFVTREWNIVNGKGNEIIYNTEVVKSNLCDYNNAQILVRGDITVRAAPEAHVAFKNWAPFY